MKFGYLSVNDAGGMLPGELARELEARGFESLWLPEHSHLPVDSVGTFPDPSRVMPDGYAHMMNPFVSLMAAAASTSTLVLGTGMSVGLEHDLLDLACTAATLDVLSDSRLILGLGVGWNAKELHNHRPQVPFNKRYTALRERVAALRAAYADIWGPVDTALISGGKCDVAGRVSDFHRRVGEAGRNPEDVAITLFNITGVTDRMIDLYRSLDIERFVFGPPRFDRHAASETLKYLDVIQKYLG